MTTWYYKGRPASCSRIFLATLTSRLSTPLPFLFGFAIVLVLPTTARLLIGTPLDLSFAFILGGCLVAYTSLGLLALSFLRLLDGGC
jgi:hypothetical protein